MPKNINKTSSQPTHLPKIRCTETHKHLADLYEAEQQGKERVSTTTQSRNAASKGPFASPARRFLSTHYR